jgi:hypothetical protein
MVWHFKYYSELPRLSVAYYITRQNNNNSTNTTLPTGIYIMATHNGMTSDYFFLLWEAHQNGTVREVAVTGLYNLCVLLHIYHRVITFTAAT